MVQQRECHLVVPEIDVVLGHLDEEVCSAVVPVAEGGFVVHERAPVVFERGVDVTERVQEASCDEGFAVVVAEFGFAVAKAFK